MPDQGMPESGYTKRLTIEIMGTFLGMAGMDKFRSAMSEVKRLQQQGAKDAEQAAAVAEKNRLSALRQVEQLSRQELSIKQRLERDKLLAEQQALAGRETAHQRTMLRIQQQEQTLSRVQSDLEANRVKAAAFADQQILANRKQMAGAITRGVGQGLGLSGTVMAGVGVGALAGGFELARYGANWQTFMLQQQAKGNFGLPGQAGYVSPTQLQNFVTNYGVQTGADFQQLATAARFGSDFGFNWQTNQNLVKAATMAALPAGGDISQYAQSIGGAMVNFPGMNPMAVANMITTAARAGRADPNDFTNAVSRLLVMVGQFHNPKLLPQALAAVAALTRKGLPPDVAAMMVYNMLFHIIKTSRSQQNALYAFDQRYGTNLEADFTPQALTSKGITGILNDLTAAQVGPGALAQMLPDIRGYFGALGLTNGGAGDYQSIAGQVQNAPKVNPVGNFFHQYLGTTNAQAKQLTNQLKLLSITLGTDLLPIFNKWMKDDLVPLVKNLDQWAKANEPLLKQLVQFAPYLIAAGVGLKGFSLLLGATSGDGAIGRVGMFSAKLLGIKGASFAARDGLKAAGTAATDAIGTAGAGGAGTGILGMAAAIGVLASAFIQLKLAQSVTDNSGMGWVLKSFMANPLMAPFIAEDLWLAKKLGIKIPGTGSSGGSGPSGSGVSTYQALSTLNPQGSYFGGFGKGSTYNPGTNNFLGYNSQGVIYAGAPVGSVTDTDFASGPKPIKLPGNSKARYRYLGMLFDDGKHTGAGFVELWETPPVGAMVAGHFAVLHLSWVAGLSRGKWYPGGTTIGRSGHPAASVGDNNTGFWHLCVQADAPARAYFAMAEGASVPGTGSGLNLTGMGIAGNYRGNFASAGKQYNVDPSILAGISMAESSGFTAANAHNGVVNSSGYGDMGIPGKSGQPSSSTTYQITHSAQYLHDRVQQVLHDTAYYNRHQAAAHRVLDELGVPKKDQGRNQVALVIAIASYNTGYAGLDKYETQGMNYARTVLANAMHANHGVFPATWYTGGGTWTGTGTGGPGGSIPTTSPGAAGGPGRGLPGTVEDKNQRQWSKFHKLYAKDNAALNEILSDPKYKNADGTINFAAMPPAVRKAVDQYLRQIGFEKYMMTQATLNEDVQNPAVRGPLISDAWSQYMEEYRNPESYFNSTKSKSGASSNAGRSIPVHIIGHCAAEAQKAAQAKKNGKTVESHLKVAQDTNKVLGQIKQELELHTQYLHQLTDGGGKGARTILGRNGALKVKPGIRG